MSDDLNPGGSPYVAIDPSWPIVCGVDHAGGIKTRVWARTAPDGTLYVISDEQTPDTESLMDYGFHPSIRLPVRELVPPPRRWWQFWRWGR